MDEPPHLAGKRVNADRKCGDPVGPKMVKAPTMVTAVTETPSIGSRGNPVVRTYH